MYLDLVETNNIIKQLNKKKKKKKKKNIYIYIYIYIYIHIYIDYANYGNKKKIIKACKSTCLFTNIYDFS